MQTAMTRANMVFTFFATVAAALAIAVTLSDLLHTPDPPVAIKLRSVKQLGHAPRVRADVAALSLSLEADLSKAFSWNTKQLFVFLQADYATPGQPVNQV
jgi:signal peptidase complex subunit 3